MKKHFTHWLSLQENYYTQANEATISDNDDVTKSYDATCEAINNFVPQEMSTCGDAFHELRRIAYKSARRMTISSTNNDAKIERMPDIEAQCESMKSDIAQIFVKISKKLKMVRLRSRYSRFHLGVKEEISELMRTWSNMLMESLSVVRARVVRCINCTEKQFLDVDMRIEEKLATCNNLSDMAMKRDSGLYRFNFEPWYHDLLIQLQDCDADVNLINNLLINIEHTDSKQRFSDEKVSQDDVWFSAMLQNKDV